jgi:DNA-binding PadR family transcriptional regulator
VTLTEVHIKLLQQLEAEPRSSSVRLPPLCDDLEQAGYVKITPTNVQDFYVEITPAGREALQRVARQAQREQ